MFNRSELKRNGLEAVKHYYIWGLLACIIYYAFDGSLFQHDISVYRVWDAVHSGNYTNIITESYNETSFIDSSLMALFGIMGLLFQLIKGVLGIFWGIFVVNVLEVGLFRFFLKNREKDTPISELSVPFQKNYKNIVAVQFFKSLYIFIGTICLIVPGVILYYKYYFVSYLLADNPNLTTEEALEQSSKMTDGLKFDIFIFDLSFIGWYILSSLIPFLGNYVIYPYVYASRSELYVCLKERRLGVEYSEMVG